MILLTVNKKQILVTVSKKQILLTVSKKQIFCVSIVSTLLLLAIFPLAKNIRFTYSFHIRLHREIHQITNIQLEQKFDSCNYLTRL